MSLMIKKLNFFLFVRRGLAIFILLALIMPLATCNGHLHSFVPEQEDMASEMPA